MKKFLFLYYNKAGKGGGTFEEWQKWSKELGDHLIDFGNPLQDGGQAVSKNGVMGVKSLPATGYSLIKANSLDEAVNLAKGSPVINAEDGAVCVYETLPM